MPITGYKTEDQGRKRGYRLDITASDGGESYYSGNRFEASETFDHYPRLPEIRALIQEVQATYRELFSLLDCRRFRGKRNHG